MTLTPGLYGALDIDLLSEYMARLVYATLRVRLDMSDFDCAPGLIWLQRRSHDTMDAFMMDRSLICYHTSLSMQFLSQCAVKYIIS